jgi:hypothetical protein
MTDRSSPTPVERLFALATIVLEKTRSNELEWKEANPFAFYVKLGNYYLQVESEDQDERHPYNVHIEDSNGIETMLTLSTREEPFGDHPPANWQGVIETLYKEARSKGSSTERALDEMLAIVEKPTGTRDDDVPF